MPGECELRSKMYEEVKIVPVAVAVKGEVISQNDMLGFFFVDYDATMLAAGEEATLITKAEKCAVIKNSGETWAPGEIVYWDPGNSWFTNVAGALDVAGHIIEAAASADIEGFISFNGMAEFLKT